MTRTNRRPTSRSPPNSMRLTKLPTPQASNASTYGHSGGGAVALAYAAARGDRLTSLAVDERASDFTPEGNEVYGWRSSTKLCASAGRRDLADRDRWPYLIPDAARDRGRGVGRDDVAHPVMAAALASRSSRLHGGRISAVTCGVPLLVRVHRRRQRHEHSVLTDPVDEAGWLQDHP